MIALTQWGEDNLLGQDAPVKVIDRTTGKRLRAHLLNESNEVVDLGLALLSKRGA